MISFIAEVKETKQSKRNLDNIYSIKLETDDASILSLGALPPDKTVTVTVQYDTIKPQINPNGEPKPNTV